MLTARHGVLTIVAALMLTGCSRGPKVWSEKTLTMDVPAADLTELHVASHNGAITATGADRTDVAIRAKLRAGARTQAAADACLAAIELVSEYAGEGVHRVGWRWNQPQHADWSASVAFQIDVPADLALRADTHNGAIKASNLSAPCTLSTHNGAITARAITADVHAETHNGRIDCAALGPQVHLVSHNGAVQLRATDAETLGGRLETHNGDVELVVGEQTSVRLDCSTDNGRVTCDAPIEQAQSTRTRLRGQLGGGGEDLTLTTRNGSIHIRQGG